MQVVIFAAGRGSRLMPLTKELPKPMLEVCGIPILEHTFKSLPDSIDEVILVVGYLNKKIIDYFDTEYDSKKIKYVVQDELLGTFNALNCAKPFLNKSKFLCLVGDDFYKKEDLKKLMETNLGFMVKKQDELGRFSNCIEDENGNLMEITNDIEKQKENNLVFTGACVLDRDIFNEDIVVNKSGEQALPPMIVSLSKKRFVKVVHADFWCSVTTKGDIGRIESVLNEL